MLFIIFIISNIFVISFISSIIGIISNIFILFAEIGRGNICITESTQSCCNTTSICRNLFAKMTKTQQRLHEREHLLEEALAYYKDRKLYVKFANKIVEDMEGIARSFFTSFW